ncbi:MAG: BamA/TamA family outer membrane protein, partial [bacterium]
RDRYLGISLGHRINLQNSLYLKSRLSERNFTPYDGRTTIAEDLSGSGSTNTSLQLQAGVQRDTRTYRPWASSGYVAKLSLATSFDVNSPDIAYVQPFLALGGLVSPSERIHLAARTELSSFVGNPPLYRQFILNRDNGVRTAMAASYEGTWRSIGSVELRSDLLPIRYITLPSFEFMRSYARNLKFGISATLFVDGGVVGGATAAASNLPDLQATDGWEVSYGVGLIFHVPYRDVIRIEAARSGRFPADGILVRFRVGPLF